MRVLAIDPATACGWAVFEDGKPVAGGVWDLAPKRHEGGGMRFIRLSASLRQVFAGQPLDMVFYELARGHEGRADLGLLDRVWTPRRGNAIPALAGSGGPGDGCDQEHGEPASRDLAAQDRRTRRGVTQCIRPFAGRLRREWA